MGALDTVPALAVTAPLAPATLPPADTLPELLAAPDSDVAPPEGGEVPQPIEIANAAVETEKVARVTVELVPPLAPPRND
jgi:hypothetical protein